MTQLGPRARQIRQQRGESQETVARRAGIATGTYLRFENGHNEPVQSTLEKIAYGLGVTVADLYDQEPVAS
jgi:transcriptional regulator with XRE-family HTH domain